MSGPQGEQTFGGSLPGQVSGAYRSALGNAMGQGSWGDQAWGQGAEWANQAAGQSGEMASMRPVNVEAGQLGRTDLTPYMSPYTKGVIEATMGELNRQEQMQGNDLASRAQKAGSFGGDRFAIQMAENNRNFDTLRKDAISKLYQDAFTNAQGAATGDINRKFQADTGNQALAGNMWQTGTGNLMGLGQNAAQTGAGLYSGAGSTLGNLANMGFGWGQQVNENNLALGSLQQKNNQMILDAIKGQVGGFTEQGRNALLTLLGAQPNVGSAGTTSSSTNPGVLGTIGGILGAVGSLIP